jgi:hypothetical protein
MTNQISLAQLPDGTALEVMVRYGPFDVAHQGILQRALNGQILILENSKKHGRAHMTTFEDFSEGRQVKVIYIPRTAEESFTITYRARNDVASGILWTVGDNCQDFVSRAVTGRSGSRTRDGIAVMALLGLVIGAFLAS